MHHALATMAFNVEAGSLRGSDRDASAWIARKQWRLVASAEAAGCRYVVVEESREPAQPAVRSMTGGARQSSREKRGRSRAANEGKAASQSSRRRSKSRSTRTVNRGSTAQQLHAAAIRLLRALRTVDAVSGLPAPQLSALGVLVFDGPRTLGELAASEGVKPPSMTKTVQGLEAAGMVRRKQDPDDRRVAVLHATARGERTLTSGQHRRLRELESLMADLPARDVATLRDAAAIIRQMIDNRRDPEQ